MFVGAVQGSRIGVSACRRIRQETRSPRVWRGTDALPRVRRCTSKEPAKAKLGETNGKGPQLESA
jgi:hypothetical protein